MLEIKTEEKKSPSHLLFLLPPFHYLQDLNKLFFFPFGVPDISLVLLHKCHHNHCQNEAEQEETAREEDEHEEDHIGFTCCS